MLVSLIVLTAGCAAPASPPRTAADLDGAIASWAREDETSPRARSLRREYPRPLTAPVRIARERPAPVERGRPVDVRLHGAPLASALALLADAANVGLVIGEGVTGTVSVDLRRVRPLQAMRALAEAHGVELTLVGRTIVARGRASL